MLDQIFRNAFQIYQCTDRGKFVHIPQVIFVERAISFLGTRTKFGSCILWGPATNASDDISVDTLIDTRLSIGRYSIEYRSIYRSSIDRCINRYSYRSLYLVAHQDFTNASPILHRYCTDASLTLNLHRVYWLTSVHILFDTLIGTRLTLGRHSNGR